VYYGLDSKILRRIGDVSMAEFREFVRLNQEKLKGVAFVDSILEQKDYARRHVRSEGGNMSLEQTPIGSSRKMSNRALLDEVGAQTKRLVANIEGASGRRPVSPPPLGALDPEVKVSLDALKPSAKSVIGDQMQKKLDSQETRDLDQIEPTLAGLTPEDSGDSPNKHSCGPKRRGSTLKNPRKLKTKKQQYKNGHIDWEFPYMDA
jgi:hypothetical protein